MYIRHLTVCRLVDGLLRLSRGRRVRFMDKQGRLAIKQHYVLGSKVALLAFKEIYRGEIATLRSQ